MMACGNMHSMQEIALRPAHLSWVGLCLSPLSGLFCPPGIPAGSGTTGYQSFVKRRKIAEPKLGFSQYNMHVNKDFGGAKAISSARTCSEWSVRVGQIVGLSLSTLATNILL
jgi:hypothetical protein